MVIGKETTSLVRTITMCDENKWGIKRTLCRTIKKMREEKGVTKNRVERQVADGA